MNMDSQQESSTAYVKVPGDGPIETHDPNNTPAEANELLNGPSDQAETANKQDNEKNCLGIVLKKETTYWNVFAIFYVYFLMTSIGGYVNVQIVYLLRDPLYFAMDEAY